MLKKTIEFEDFNGETKSESFYFHLSKAELVEMEMSMPGGMGEYLKAIVENGNGGEIIREFKKIVLGAYGQRSPDGSRFIKNQQIREDFESHPAYSVLFMEIMTDSEKAAEFVNGIVPKGLNEDVQRMIARENIKPVPDAPVEPVLPYGTHTEGETQQPGVITRKDLVSMSHDEISSKLAQGWTIEQDPSLQG